MKRLGMLIFVLSLTAPARADKAFAVQEILNENQAFMVHVDVDRKDRVYQVGETMTVTVTPEKDCYLYLLYYDATDNMVCLYPNEFAAENFVRGKTTVTIPTPGANFALKAHEPTGDELLQVIATSHPVNLFGDKNLKLKAFTAVSKEELEGADDRLDQQRSKEWAEARISIKTVGVRDEQTTQQARRLAICIGISDYLNNDRISDLRFSDKDAVNFREMLTSVGGVRPEDVLVLTNDQATKANIREAIFVRAAEVTRPGDTLIVYYSGHGMRAADTNGDEEDGFDEFLVPHDGRVGELSSMISDDEFARWLQELTGRSILIVMDSCYSGGASKSVKGLASGPSAATAGLDFFDGELRRAKDIGQTGTAVIAASKPDQVAWEMPTGEGSALTHLFIQSVISGSGDANGDQRITVTEAFDKVRDEVKAYVQQTFMVDQEPVMIDNAGDSIFIRP